MNSRFANRNPAQNSPRAAQRKSRYAGIQAATPRPPMPVAGEYRFRITGATEGHNPGTGTDSAKFELQIVDLDAENNRAHKVDDIVSAIFLISGKAGPSGLARTKALVMAAAGYDDEQAYNEADPDGYFIDAALGGANDFVDLFEGAQPIVGRLVDCQVTRGGATPDGDYYREYAWAVVPEDDQDQQVSLRVALEAKGTGG